jgi:anti-anti-sigma factor
MRHSVPFIGEEQIARAQDDQSEGKRRGQVIDEILSTDSEITSWDYVVSGKSPQNKQPGNKSTRAPKKSVATLASEVAQASKEVHREANTAHIDWVPINNGQGLRISVSGNLDQELVPEWRRLLQESQSSAIAEFEIDMTQAPNLGLTGIAMLLLLKEQRGSRQQDFTLRHCNQQVEEQLRWAGMDHYFVIQGMAPSDKTKP